MEVFFEADGNRSNHKVNEITFSPDFKIGDFEAFDYFSNGSFYLLNVPGHATGHMCALARTTESSFMLLGADTCHFAGALRPSPYNPLPETLDSATAGLDSYFVAIIKSTKLHFRLISKSGILKLLTILATAHSTSSMFLVTRQVICVL